MSYITTVTGKHFDPMKPVDREIDIFDIAHALSLICRGNGHIKTFYSVAQHSIACAEEAFARGCTPVVVLGCLLHDASEAYLSDVTRPVKKDLPQYLQAENALQNAIWRRFIGRDLTSDEKEKIFEISTATIESWYMMLCVKRCRQKLSKINSCSLPPTDMKILQFALQRRNPCG